MIGMSRAIGRDALLQVEAVEVRKRDIEHQAARSEDARAGEELLRGREGLRLPACASDQQLQRFAHRDVVVNDEHDGRGCDIGQPPCSSSLSISVDASAARRSAALSASSRAVSLNGLNRHSTAPCSSRRGRTVSSPCAVMKTIGISCRATLQFPLEIGSATCPAWRCRGSGTWSGRRSSDARNASADENACDRKAELPQQVGQRLAHGLVVIDDRHERTAVTYWPPSCSASRRWRLGWRQTGGARHHPWTAGNREGERGARTVIGAAHSRP